MQRKVVRFVVSMVSLLAAAGVPTLGTAQGGPPNPDPRVGLKPGLWDAGEALWNLKLVSATKPTEKFRLEQGGINSDLTFLGNYVIQGNFNGFQVWDISDPAHPVLKKEYYCPASQSDVSVYKNLLVVSAESGSARLDCGSQGVRDTVSKERIRGIRLFDITNIMDPKYIGNVQTCRGSHTHSLLVDPKDQENVYVYISGSAGLRSPTELPGCVDESPDKNPNSPLMRLEVIKIPLAHPERAAIVSSPRVFENLKLVQSHGEAPEDIAEAKKAVEDAKAKGQFTAVIFGTERPLPSQFTAPMLDSVVKARGGSGVATAADSAALRAALPGILEKMFGGDHDRMTYMQCHDITLYPAIGRAGGACEGFGFLMDISNPVAPVRLDAAADSNFSYWHSATFNNDGTKILFSDEWGGGGGPKCRATDKKEWGADAIYTLSNGKLQFQSYYKMPAAQTSTENCVAHNGTMIPIPGRDIMVQAWYQGGISMFEWTDPKNPREIGFHDRGPIDPNRLVLGGSWSAYWYNGLIVSSEIVRGLDIYELVPSQYISQNEIDAAKTVKFTHENAQDQTKFVWPASFALSRAYVDQLERSQGLSAARIAAARNDLAAAEKASGAARKSALTRLAGQLDADAGSSSDADKVKMLAASVRELAK
jgi:hypothetical protein